jgi:hypothetical protein
MNHCLPSTKLGNEAGNQTGTCANGTGGVRKITELFPFIFPHACLWVWLYDGFGRNSS